MGTALSRRSVLFLVVALFSASQLRAADPKLSASRSFTNPQGKSCLVTFLSKSEKEDEVAVTLASCLPQREGSGGVELTDSSQEVYRSTGVIVAEDQLNSDPADIPAEKDLAIVLFPRGTASALDLTPRMPSSNSELKAGDSFPLEVSSSSLPGTPVFDHKGKILSLFRGTTNEGESKDKNPLALVSLISNEATQLFGSAKRFDQYALSGVPSQQKAGSELGIFFNRCRQQCQQPQTTCNYYYTQPVCQPQCRPQVVVVPATPPAPVQTYPAIANTNQNLNSNRNSNHLNSHIASSNTNHNHVAPVQTQDNHSSHSHHSPVTVNPKINVNPQISPNINVNPNIVINLPPGLQQKLDNVESVSRRLEQQERAHASVQREQASRLAAAEAENRALAQRLEAERRQTVVARNTSYVSTPSYSVHYTPPSKPASYVEPAKYVAPVSSPAPSTTSSPVPTPAIEEVAPTIELPKEPEPAPYVGLYETVSVEKKPVLDVNLQQQVARNAKELSGNSERNTAFVARNESPFLNRSVIVNHSDNLTLVARGGKPEAATVVAKRGKSPAEPTVTLVKK